MAQQYEDLPGAPAEASRVAATDASAANSDAIEKTFRRPLPASAHELLRQFQPDDARGRGDVSVVYLSTPITTGPRLLDWLAANQSQDASLSPEGSGVDVVREEVIAENIAHLGPLRDKIRARWPNGRLIDPTELTVSGWSQWEYHRFWVEVLNQFVDRVVFADGWELSTGCTIEYATALRAGVPTEDARGKSIAPEDAERSLRRAARVLSAAGRDSAVTLAAAERAAKEKPRALKDSQLAALAAVHNVASFVSVSPGLPLLRHRFIRGHSLSRSAGLHQAVQLLLSVSASASVNVRTFKPGSPKGNPFKYGLTRVDDVLETVRSFADLGYYCIINETISVDDGGVSGVTLGGIAEFAPDDTPRVVEKGDTASLPESIARSVLRTIYYPELSIPFDPAMRIEFSVHPSRVGHKGEHLIVWEAEDVDPIELDVAVVWPNRFSRLLGDKTFGLLVADALGMSVPATTAVLRRVAPFRFGRPTGTGEWWMRTAPVNQTPGHFTTTAMWTDPFETLSKEDADCDVAGVLAQEGVAAVFSGATLPVSNASGHLVEGVQGTGADFMLGDSPSVRLPAEVEGRVRALLDRLEDTLGSGVRIEWADDGETTWVLQLHRVAHRTAPGVFSEGSAESWLQFDPTRGLDALQELIAEARKTGDGIEVTQPIGLTSHVGDLLRKARIPGRLSSLAVSSRTDVTA